MYMVRKREVIITSFDCERFKMDKDYSKWTRIIRNGLSKMTTHDDVSTRAKSCKYETRVFCKCWHYLGAEPRVESDVSKTRRPTIILIYDVQNVYFKFNIFKVNSIH